MVSEEAKVIREENSTEVLTAFNRIPYALINAEVSGTAKDTLDELTQICKYYKVYKNCLLYTFSEPTRRTPISYAVFCLKKKKKKKKRK